MKLYNPDHLLASPELLQEVKETAIDENYLNFAYTDYGGSFYDIVCIDYFLEHYPDNIKIENTIYFGRNAIVFNTKDISDLTDSFSKENENYPLGFEELEDFYYSKVNEEYVKFFDSFLADELKNLYIFDEDKLTEWFFNEKSGHYQVDTQGLDVCSSSLIEELLDLELIKKDLD